MKKLLLNILFLASCFTIYAQGSNVSIFTEEGEKFILYLNGEKLNNHPDNRVAALDIVSDVAQLKLVFVNEQIPEITKTVMLENNMEYTAVVKKNKKGKYVMRSNLGTPIQRETEPQRSETKTNSKPTEQTQTTITTTTTKAGVPTGDQANIDISVSEKTTGFNLSVSVSDNTDIKASTETTTITTSTSTSSTDTEKVKPSNGCVSAMTNSQYTNAKTAISNKSFSEERMTVFKQIIKSRCISVDQVIGLMGLFTYEEEKLEVAKTAYSRTVDLDEYYRVNDALTYSDSIEELDQFLSNQ